MGKKDEAVVLTNVVGVPYRGQVELHHPVAEVSTLHRIETEYI